MRRFVFTVLSFYLFNAYVRGQSSFDSTRILGESTTSGIATGIHIGKYPMLELGYFRHVTFEFPMTWGNSYTLEACFLKNFAFAPKASYWINVLYFNVGVNIPWYFDFKGNNSLKFRPEIGYGYKNFKINYAINLSVTNRDMEYIGKNFISINYYIGLKEN